MIHFLSVSSPKKESSPWASVDLDICCMSCTCGRGLDVLVAVEFQGPFWLLLPNGEGGVPYIWIQTFPLPYFISQ